jgi:iron-sulfur cluster repair protein YtfE (RIC family)
MTRTGLGSHVMRTFIEHEHAELRPGIERIHDSAFGLAQGPRPEAIDHIRDVTRWIDRVLRPHMAWEEGWLYPQIDERIGTPWATRAIRFDHQQICRVADRVRDDLTGMSHDSTLEGTLGTQHDLFALEALLGAHVEREERFLLPILDERLGEAQGTLVS